MKKNKLTIAHITDLHIGGGSDLVQGINVRENLRKALYSESVEAADLILLLGDLTDDGSIDGYEFVKSEMERRNKPWFFILGNHDDLKNCFTVFDKQKDCPFKDSYDYTFDFEGRHFICIDSSNGKITDDQLEWLKTEAAKTEEEVFLLTHYPPCICGHKFMDSRFALKDIEKIQSVLASIKNLKYIFCGHYHAKFDVTLPSGQIVHVAPPTQMQIDPEQVNFSLKTSNPAWQVVHFTGNDLAIENFAL